MPAASLRRLDHPHDTFPCPSHQDQQRRTGRSPAGSTRLEPLTPQNLATSAKVPPGHPVPVLTITPFPHHILASFTWPWTVHDAPATARPTASPSSRTETPKTPVSALEKKSKNEREKDFKRPRGSGRPGGQSTRTQPPSRHFPVSISPRSIVQDLENARRLHQTREPPHKTWPPRSRCPHPVPSHPQPSRLPPPLLGLFHMDLNHPLRPCNR